jgi:hypothetical protein
MSDEQLDGAEAGDEAGDITEMSMAELRQKLEQQRLRTQFARGAGTLYAVPEEAHERLRAYWHSQPRVDSPEIEDESVAVVAAAQEHSSVDKGSCSEVARTLSAGGVA